MRSRGRGSDGNSVPIAGQDTSARGTNVPAEGRRLRIAASSSHDAMTKGQRIRYLRTPDGVQLAWAEAGAGPVLVKAANWLSHLEYDLESPVWRHWIRFFADHF